MITPNHIFEIISTYFNSEDIDNPSLQLFISQHSDNIISQSHLERIGVQILVKNQERHIIRTLNHIAPFANIITVADTGSDDSTQELLNSYKLRHPDTILLNLPWVEDYGSMRNLLNTRSPFTEWVLILDADEEFDSAGLNIDDLHMALATLDLYFHGKDISISFRQRYLNRQSVAWPERLFKRSDTLTFWGYVHEELRSKISLIHFKSKLTVLNLGTSSEEVHKFDKLRRYYELSQKNIFLEPNNLKWTALEPFDIAVLEDSDYSARISRLLNICGDSKETSEYEPILRQHLISVSLRQANLSRAKELVRSSSQKFPKNSTFVFDKYYLKLISYQLNIEAQIRQLKIDVQHLQDDAAVWSSYSSADGFEELLIKLLIKSEHYESAQKLLTNREHSLPTDSQILIAPEIQWQQMIKRSIKDEKC